MARFQMIYDRPWLRGKYREPIATKRPESIDLSKIIDCEDHSRSPDRYKYKMNIKCQKLIKYLTLLN